MILHVQTIDCQEISCQISIRRISQAIASKRHSTLHIVGLHSQVRYPALLNRPATLSLSLSVSGRYLASEAPYGIPIGTRSRTECAGATATVAVAVTLPLASPRTPPKRCGSVLVTPIVIAILFEATSVKTISVGLIPLRAASFLAVATARLGVEGK